MSPDIQNLLTVLASGKVLWSLCAGGLLCLLVDAIWPKKMTLLVFAVGLLSLIFSGVLAIDQWANPAVQTGTPLFVMDRLTVFFLILTILVGIFTFFNAIGYLKLHQTLTAEFSSLLLFSIVGMILLFSSDHLFMNFIGIEIMSLAVYVLVGSHKKSSKSNEAAVKYYVLSSAASAVLLFGIALFYGSFGTFHLSQLSQLVASPELDYLPKIALALILAGLFFKLGLVPFHFWAPDVYQGAPAPVTGFMATGVKAAAFGFALRLFMNLGVLDMPQVQTLLQWTVIATLLVGNIMAISQDDVKRMLAYSSISHAGFLLFAILAGYHNSYYMPESSSVVLFYLLAYLFMTLGAFAILSLMVAEKQEATTFADLQGLGKKHPLLAGVFALFMLSMLGLPGTVGFAAKYGVVALAVKNGHIVMAVVAVLMSVISAYYYLRPIGNMFFYEPLKSENLVGEISLPVAFTYVTIGVCAFLVISLGLQPEGYLKATELAASVFQTVAAR